MGTGTYSSAQLLNMFSERVLLRTRSGTGVAVYKHDDGTWGFVWRASDVAASRTASGRVSYSLCCPECGTRVTVCTTLGGARVATPCECAAGREPKPDDRALDSLLRWPEIDLDYFAASVQLEVERLGGFGLRGMIRGYLHDFWPTIGRRPDPALWARFFLASTGDPK